MIDPYQMLIARYQIMPEDVLKVAILGLEAELAASQSRLAAARKAQKNQKRAAKDRKKVVE